MDFHKVKMTLTPTALGSVVEVDGMVMKGLTAITVSASTEQVTTVTLSFHASVETDAEAVIKP